MIFRADGNSRIGLGHFTRTLALATMLKDEFDRSFALSEPTAYQVQELNKEGIPLQSLPEAPMHFEVFLDSLKGNEIVVLDNYFFDTAYQKQIKSKGCKLVCIDDLAEQHFVADAVINHSGGVREDIYSCEPHTKLYVGLDYALLRKEFLQAAPNRTAKEDRREVILVCLGGADPSNETLKILKVLEQKGEQKPVYVVVGAANKNAGTITAFANGTELNVTILQGLTASEMLSYMQLCSTAITAPSSISFEYIAVGGVLYLCLTADNQKSIYNYFRDTVAFDFSEYPVTDAKRIEKILANQARILDGKSADRLKKAFWELN